VRRRPGKRYSLKRESVYSLQRCITDKRNSDGIVERYKARLVLPGHLQRQDIDFFETYAPVVDFTAVLIALSNAYRMGMAIHHLDVKCAFLHGTVKENICMRLPDQFHLQMKLHAS
jgi:Reverse transcriptase (RNA-dependent DNA polymerase)